MSPAILHSLHFTLRLPNIRLSNRILHKFNRNSRRFSLCSSITWTDVLIMHHTDQTSRADPTGTLTSILDMEAYTRHLGEGKFGQESAIQRQIYLPYIPRPSCTIPDIGRSISWWSRDTQVHWPTEDAMVSRSGISIGLRGNLGGVRDDGGEIHQVGSLSLASFGTFRRSAATKASPVWFRTSMVSVNYILAMSYKRRVDVFWLGPGCRRAIISQTGDEGGRRDGYAPEHRAWWREWIDGWRRHLTVLESRIQVKFIQLRSMSYHRDLVHEKSS